MNHRAGEKKYYDFFLWEDGVIFSNLWCDITQNWLELITISFKNGRGIYYRGKALGSQCSFNSSFLQLADRCFRRSHSREFSTINCTHCKITALQPGAVAPHLPTWGRGGSVGGPGKARAPPRRVRVRRGHGAVAARLVRKRDYWAVGDIYMEEK